MQRELEQAQRGGEGPATVAYDPDDVGGWDPGVDAGVPLGRQGGQRAPAAPSGPPQGRIVGGFGGKPQGRTGGREQSTDISSRQKQYLLQDEEGGPFYSAPLPAGFKWALDDVGPVDLARPPLRPLIAANTPIHEIIAKSAELRAARQQEKGGGFRSANPRQKPMFSSDLKEPLAELEIDGRVPSATLDRDVFLRDANGQSLRTSVRALLSGVLSRDASGVLLGQLPASRQADVLNAAIELGQARGFDQRFDGDPSAIQRQGRVVDMPAASTWDLGLVNVKGEPVLDATGRQRFVKVNSGMPFADVEVDPDQTAAHNRLRTETYGNEIANIQHNSRTPVKTIAALEAMGGVLREPTAQERARLAPKREGVVDTLAYIHELGDKKTPVYKYASAGRTEGAQGAESMGDGSEGLYRIGSPTKYNSRQMFGQLSDFVMGGRREILPRRDIVQGDELVTVPAGAVVPALFHPYVRVRLAEEQRLSQLAGRKVTAYGIIDELAGHGFALPPEPSPYSNARPEINRAINMFAQANGRAPTDQETVDLARGLLSQYVGGRAPAGLQEGESALVGRLSTRASATQASDKARELFSALSERLQQDNVHAKIGAAVEQFAQETGRPPDYMERIDIARAIKAEADAVTDRSARLRAALGLQPQSTPEARAARFEAGLPAALRGLDAEVGTPEHDALMRVLAQNAQMINEDRARPVAAQEYEYAAPLQNVPATRQRELLRATYALPSTLRALSELPAARSPETRAAERYLQAYAGERRRATAGLPVYEEENGLTLAPAAMGPVDEAAARQMVGGTVDERDVRSLADEGDLNAEGATGFERETDERRKPDLSALENLDDADVDRLEEQGLPGYTDPNALARPAGLSDFERRMDAYLQRLGVSAQGARQRPAHIPAHLWPKFVEQAQWAVGRGYDRA